jgi:ubiquinol-cytochrome c reductase iron-sulfur subunit
MKTVEETPVNRRDMLRTVSGSVATVGMAAAAWPLINHLNPTVRAGDFVDIDLLSIPEGTQQILKWWGQPWFVWHRTAQDVELARAAFQNEMKDSLARNANLSRDTAVKFESRAMPGDPRFVVVSANCTREVDMGGCGVLEADRREYGYANYRWLCPCCSSKFDSNGCVYRGPAPSNLPIPAYAMLGRSKIRVLPNPLIWRQPDVG